ncbi:putative phospholipid hydroperoxide glutathione peroxidase 6 [Tropilaelaps mercedesae]|uniref:Putative phospholipid hydroperoxide glutathione peroxidase 6 n=1 Tax=Tropilaelaps mercedesae TaxID=418985 RepID=A0A1V9XC67_9ACAR|nr:putative phospholipid hydroperoxide glutathione peroxidase 6 [Tropilaelaps mercedesae]
MYDGVKWNFTKFVVDRNGIPVSRFSPTMPPLAIKEEILKYLNQPAKSQSSSATTHKTTEL